MTKAITGDGHSILCIVHTNKWLQYNVCSLSQRSRPSRSTDEKAMRNSNRTNPPTRQESKRISRRIVPCASRPKLHSHQHQRSHQNTGPVLTYPPNTGPIHRAKLTMLCATPFAYPTACGGVTRHPSVGAQVQAQKKRTVVEEYRYGGV